MQEFGVVQDRFPGSDDVYKNWGEASIQNLTDEQKTKLLGILYPKTEVVVSEAHGAEIDATKHISVDGNIADILHTLPDNQRKDIEYGIQHILSEGYKGDLVLGRWAKVHTGGWEQTIGDATFLEKYNLKAKPADKAIPGSSNILLILRVSPTGSNTATISAELLEIPASGNGGGRMAMLMPGMAFHKPLDAAEFITELDTHKADLSIAA